MKDDELNEFANQFINLWQENFTKAIADQKIIEYMMQMGANMQQFYDKTPFNDKSFTTAAANPFVAGYDQLFRRNDDDRINELERRIENLEEQIKQSKTRSRKSSKK